VDGFQLDSCEMSPLTQVLGVAAQELFIEVKKKNEMIPKKKRSLIVLAVKEKFIVLYSYYTKHKPEKQ
jgi:hypothetical protein